MNSIKLRILTKGRVAPACPEQPSLISELVRTFTRLFQGYSGPSTVFGLPALVRGTLTRERPVCIAASPHHVYSIRFLQSLGATRCSPPAGPFPVRAGRRRSAYTSTCPPFLTDAPKRGPAPCSVPDLTPWLQLLQDRHHFHLVHLTASVCTGLRKFNPPPPPKHARNRPLNCPFLRQNSKREQFVLHALRLTINAKTELRLLIPKKCL